MNGRTVPLSFQKYPSVNGRYTLYWEKSAKGSHTAFIKFDGNIILTSKELPLGHSQDDVRTVTQELLLRLEVHVRSVVLSIKKDSGSGVTNTNTQ